MKRTRPLAAPGISCLLLLLLLLLLHLPAALASSSVAPSGRKNPLLPVPVPRKPLARSHSAAGLPKGPRTDLLSDTTGKSRLAEEQLVASLVGQAHVQVLSRHRLEHQQARSSSPGRTPWTTARPRLRRAAARLHPAHLMRVGCALGTCQVQNLSHRLWQLKGQSGRQNSSPINPNSPHSYG